MPSPPSDLVLERLKRLHPKSIDLSLGRLARLLEALAHPELHLPPVVHVAGTNGKGSTLAMLDAMLRAGGWRTCRYISPHLVRFCERILFDDAPIDEMRLATVLDRCEQVNAGRAITFFEVTTAAAFMAFAETPADWVLLETGLGGEFDATNVVPAPRLCLITPISMDHEAYLGDTLEAIAHAKAGILKPGVPAIVARQEPAALAVIERRAAELGAPLTVMGREVDAQAEGGRLLVRQDARYLALPMPALDGVHQIENAGLAAAAALALTEAGLDEAAIATGLRTVRWPARLQLLRRGPLVEALPRGSTVWLDGGHNPAAGDVLARTFAARADTRPLDLVVGMLQTKDARAFLRPLAPLARHVFAVGIPGEPQAQDAHAVAEAARSLGSRATVVPSPLAAARTAAADGAASRLLVCGSLYLAGQILRDHG